MIFLGPEIIYAIFIKKKLKPFCYNHRFELERKKSIKSLSGNYHSTFVTYRLPWIKSSLVTFNDIEIAWSKF